VVWAASAELAVSVASVVAKATGSTTRNIAAARRIKTALQPTGSGAMRAAIRYHSAKPVPVNGYLSKVEIWLATVVQAADWVTEAAVDWVTAVAEVVSAIARVVLVLAEVAA
jgi:hypothetical protein